MNKIYNNINSMNPSDAKFEAQIISFGPFIFQIAKVMRDFGILKIIEDAENNNGIEFENILKKTDLSEYAVKLLLDGGLSINVISKENNKYKITKTGYFLQNDEITNINMNFVHDVCYKGMFYLDEAIKEGKPAGLKELGNWKTLYEGIPKLPEKIKKSWYDFDHYFSDSAFPKILKNLFKENPKNLLDIGGNTGKWAIECTKYSEDINVTIVDLPDELSQAEKAIKENNLENRISLFPMNVLEDEKDFPKGFDIIWMSQFLDCFSEEEIVSILKKAAKSLNDNGSIYILETYPDRQHFDVASFCLIMTSFYFTCMANGNSRMYNSNDMIKCVEKAGLKVVDDKNGISISHTLFRCQKK